MTGVPIPHHRCAVISDIHGNAVALDAVLADIEQSNINQIVCLGDVAATGPQPGEAIDRLQTLRCPVVMGNTDAFLLNPKLDPNADEDTRRFEEIDLWCAQQLNPAQLDFVRSFQPIVRMSTSSFNLGAFHGSPRSNTEVIEAATPDSALDEMLKGFRGNLLVGGHTHVQMLRRYQHRFILNPGSVGLPFERHSDGVYSPYWAEYAIIEAYDSLKFELRCIPYDARKVIKAIRNSGMPHAEWLAEGWKPPPQVW